MGLPPAQAQSAINCKICLSKVSVRTPEFFSVVENVHYVHMDSSDAINRMENCQFPVVRCINNS